MNRRILIAGLAAAGAATQARGAAMKPDVDVVKSLAPTGKLRAAINLGNGVLAQRGADGRLGGVSFALATELARRLGVPLEPVVYDAAGLFSAPRLWWMLRIFGHEHVAILDGGLPKWTAEGRPLDKGEAHPTARVFTPHFNAAAVADVAQVRDALDSGSAQVLDARAAPRFLGQAPEPRAGLASGHMPGALNLPMTDLIADGRLKEPDALEAALTAIGVSGDKPVITSCGSGVSAAVITLALARLGRPIGRLYDGSWTEWGGRSDLPVATG